MLKWRFMGRILSLSVSVILSFISTSANAIFLDLPFVFREQCLHSKAMDSGVYIRPNEGMPQRAKGILEQAPEGVYMAVGTERGIFGAIQSPKVTHLLMVDANPHICAFNNINFALIKMSKGNRELYRHLRQKASFAEWSKLAIETDALTPYERGFVTSLDLYGFLKKNLRVSENAPSDIMSFEREPGLHHFPREVHYIFDDEAFKKIYHLVSENKVESILLDLADQKSLKLLGQAMKKKNLSLSVLDISNAWSGIYLGEEGLKALVNNTKAFFNLSKQSFILATSLFFKGPKFAGENEGGNLFSRYTAYTFDYFDQVLHPFGLSSGSYDGMIDNKPSCKHALE